MIKGVKGYKEYIEERNAEGENIAVPVWNDDNIIPEEGKKVEAISSEDSIPIWNDDNIVTDEPVDPDNKFALPESLAIKLAEGGMFGMSPYVAGAVNALGRVAGVKGLGNSMRDIDWSGLGSQATLDLGELEKAYDTGYKKEYQLQHDIAEEDPITSVVGNLVGGVATGKMLPTKVFQPLGPAAAGASTAARIGKNVANAAISGAQLGALMPTHSPDILDGEALGERVVNAGIGGLAGGVLTGALETAPVAWNALKERAGNAIKGTAFEAGMEAGKDASYLYGNKYKASLENKIDNIYKDLRTVVGDVALQRDAATSAEIARVNSLATTYDEAIARLTAKRENIIKSATNKAKQAVGVQPDKIIKPAIDEIDGEIEKLASARAKLLIENEQMIQSALSGVSDAKSNLTNKLGEMQKSSIENMKKNVPSNFALKYNKLIQSVRGVLGKKYDTIAQGFDDEYATLIRAVANSVDDAGNIPQPMLNLLESKSVDIASPGVEDMLKYEIAKKQFPQYFTSKEAFEQLEDGFKKKFRPYFTGEKKFENLFSFDASDAIDTLEKEIGVALGRQPISDDLTNFIKDDLMNELQNKLIYSAPIRSKVDSAGKIIQTRPMSIQSFREIANTKFENGKEIKSYANRLIEKLLQKTDITRSDTLSNDVEDAIRNFVNNLRTKEHKTLSNVNSGLAEQLLDNNRKYAEIANLRKLIPRTKIPGTGTPDVNTAVTGLVSEFLDQGTISERVKIFVDGLKQSKNPEIKNLANELRDSYKTLTSIIKQNPNEEARVLALQRSEQLLKYITSLDPKTQQDELKAAINSVLDFTKNNLDEAIIANPAELGGSDNLLKLLNQNPIRRIKNLKIVPNKYSQVAGIDENLANLKSEKELIKSLKKFGNLDQHFESERVAGLAKEMAGVRGQDELVKLGQHPTQLAAAEKFDVAHAANLKRMNEFLKNKKPYLDQLQNPEIKSLLDKLVSSFDNQNEFYKTLNDAVLKGADPHDLNVAGSAKRELNNAINDMMLELDKLVVKPSANASPEQRKALEEASRQKATKMIESLQNKMRDVVAREEKLRGVLSAGSIGLWTSLPGLAGNIVGLGKPLSYPLRAVGTGVMRGAQRAGQQIEDVANTNTIEMLNKYKKYKLFDSALKNVQSNISDFQKMDSIRRAATINTLMQNPETRDAAKQMQEDLMGK